MKGFLKQHLLSTKITCDLFCDLNYSGCGEFPLENPPGQFPPIKFPSSEFPLGEFPPGQFPTTVRVRVRVGIHQGGITGGEFTGGELSRGKFDRGELTVGNSPGGNFPRIQLFIIKKHYIK